MTKKNTKKKPTKKTERKVTQADCFDKALLQGGSWDDMVANTQKLLFENGFDKNKCKNKGRLKAHFRHRIANPHILNVVFEYDDNGINSVKEVMKDSAKGGK